MQTVLQCKGPVLPVCMCMHFCLLYSDASLLMKLCKNSHLCAASLYVYAFLSVVW